MRFFAQMFVVILSPLVVCTAFAGSCGTIPGSEQTTVQKAKGKLKFGEAGNNLGYVICGSNDPRSCNPGDIVLYGARYMECSQNGSFNVAGNNSLSRCDIETAKKNLSSEYLIAKYGTSYIVYEKEKSNEKTNALKNPCLASSDLYKQLEKMCIDSGGKQIYTYGTNILGCWCDNREKGSHQFSCKKDSAQKNASKSNTQAGEVWQSSEGKTLKELCENATWRINNCVLSSMGNFVCAIKTTEKGERGYQNRFCHGFNYDHQCIFDRTDPRTGKSTEGRFCFDEENKIVVERPGITCPGVIEYETVANIVSKFEKNDFESLDHVFEMGVDEEEYECISGIKGGGTSKNDAKSGGTESNESGCKNTPGQRECKDGKHQGYFVCNMDDDCTKDKNTLPAHATKGHCWKDSGRNYKICTATACDTAHGYTLTQGYCKYEPNAQTKGTQNYSERTPEELCDDAKWRDKNCKKSDYPYEWYHCYFDDPTVKDDIATESVRCWPIDHDKKCGFGVSKRFCLDESNQVIVVDGIACDPKDNKEAALAKEEGYLDTDYEYGEDKYGECIKLIKEEEEGQAVENASQICIDSGGTPNTDDGCDCDANQKGLKPAEGDPAKCECIHDGYEFDATQNECVTQTAQTTIQQQKSRQIDKLEGTEFSEEGIKKLPVNPIPVIDPEAEKKQELENKLQNARDALAAAKEKENSWANRALGATTTAATSLGAMQLAEGIAERKADTEAEKQMRDYITTMKCEYGGGQGAVLGNEEITLPGGNELLEYYTEYKTLADNLKTTKAALGLSAGIESEVLYDRAQSGLYQYASTGKTGGGETSLYRALTDSESADATAWNDQKDASTKKLYIGGGAAAVGVVGGTTVNYFINRDKKEKDTKK